MQSTVKLGTFILLICIVFAVALPVHAAPEEESWNPDYALEQIKEEAGIGYGFSWDDVGKRLIDGVLHIFRWARQVSYIPLLVIITLAGVALLVGFLFSITKITRWALGIIIAAVTGWVIIQLAPAIVVGLSGFFT